MSSIEIHKDDEDSLRRNMRRQMVEQLGSGYVRDFYENEAEPFVQIALDWALSLPTAPRDGADGLPYAGLTPQQQAMDAPTVPEIEQRISEAGQ